MTKRTGGALHALRVRDFRLIAGGNMVSQMGTWVQYVARGWVARELTDNTLLIAFVFAAQWFPYLVLSPITGVIADRIDRRKIVLWGNIAMIAPALTLGLLIQLHHIAIASLVALVIAGGAAQAFTQPAANAFIPALVPPQDLHSAIALNAGLSNSTRVIGPTIGGVIISAWGVAWGFHINAISFLGVAIACVAVKTRPKRNPPSKSGYWDGLRSGITYLRANRAAMRIMTLVAAVTLLMMNAGLMSIMAKDVLHGNAGTYGLLSSGPGFGFVAAALLTTTLTNNRRRTTALLFCGGRDGRGPGDSWALAIRAAVGGRYGSVRILHNDDDHGGDDAVAGNEHRRIPRSHDGPLQCGQHRVVHRQLSTRRSGRHRPGRPVHDLAVWHRHLGGRRRLRPDRHNRRYPQRAGRARG